MSDGVSREAVATSVEMKPLDPARMVTIVYSNEGVVVAPIALKLPTSGCRTGGAVARTVDYCPVHSLSGLEE